MQRWGLWTPECGSGHFLKKKKRRGHWCGVLNQVLFGCWQPVIRLRGPESLSMHRPREHCKGWSESVKSERVISSSWRFTFIFFPSFCIFFFPLCRGIKLFIFIFFSYSFKKDSHLTASRWQSWITPTSALRKYSFLGTPLLLRATSFAVPFLACMCYSQEH